MTKSIIHLNGTNVPVNLPFNVFSYVYVVFWKLDTVNFSTLLSLKCYDNYSVGLYIKGLSDRSCLLSIKWDFV